MEDLALWHRKEQTRWPLNPFYLHDWLPGSGTGYGFFFAPYEMFLTVNVLRATYNLRDNK